MAHDDEPQYPRRPFSDPERVARGLEAAERIIGRLDEQRKELHELLSDRVARLDERLTRLEERHAGVRADATRALEIVRDGNGDSIMHRMSSIEDRFAQHVADCGTRHHDFEKLKGKIDGQADRALTDVRSKQEREAAERRKLILEIVKWLVIGALGFLLRGVWIFASEHQAPLHLPETHAGAVEPPPHY